MEAIQFINTTPEQLKEAILAGVKAEIEQLKKDYTPKEPAEYLTKNEVAALFRVNLSTLFHWNKKGKLKAYGIGGRVFYKRSEVDQALELLK